MCFKKVIFPNKTVRSGADKVPDSGPSEVNSKTPVDLNQRRIMSQI